MSQRFLNMHQRRLRQEEVQPLAVGTTSLEVMTGCAVEVLVVVEVVLTLRQRAKPWRMEDREWFRDPQHRRLPLQQRLVLHCRVHSAHACELLQCERSEHAIVPSTENIHERPLSLSISGSELQPQFSCNALGPLGEPIAEATLSARAQSTELLL